MIYRFLRLCSLYSTRSKRSFRIVKEDKILILIVEDIEDNRLLIKTALKKENYFFEEASDGQEAIDKCKNLKPDIILMDAMMPVMDGFEATKALRTLDEFKRTPILMITSLNKKDDKIKALEYGVDDFISKPFDIQELIARCRSYASISQDIKKRKIAEEALVDQHRYLQHIMDSIHDPIMVIKSDYTVELMSNNIRDKMNLDYIADINNPKCYEISHYRSTPCEGRNHECPLHQVLQTNTNTTVIHNHTTMDGAQRYVELAASPLFNKEGKCIGIIESGRDITCHLDVQSKLNEQKNLFYYQATHDSLTGLANRILFNDRLEQGIKRAKRNNTKLALFFIDLDKFKEINDTFGHKAGDLILKTVSQKILDCVREEDTLSRIGGDEFTVIMENITKTDLALTLAEKIMETFTEPIPFENKTLNISASIGISMYPDDDTDIQTLLKYADIAMYKAKKNKNNRIKLYKDNSKKKKSCL